MALQLVGSGVIVNLSDVPGGGTRGERGQEEGRGAKRSVGNTRDHHACMPYMQYFPTSRLTNAGYGGEKKNAGVFTGQEAF